MKLIAPIYYKKFKCIASQCKDNCCIGWEIDVDNDSLNNYKNINSDFSKKLVENIYEGKLNNEQNHFILNEKNRCPFLNSNNLCEVYINLGEKSMCKICTEHPRYYEWFKNFKEIGIGLACEEACRIILSETENFSTYETDISFEECDSYDEKLFNKMNNIRMDVIHFLENDSITFTQRIKNVLYHIEKIQNFIDYNDEINDIPSLQTSYNHYSSNIPTDFIFKFYQELTPLSNNWMDYLKDSISTYQNNIKEFDNFERENPHITNYLKNISIYFIWRYFMKGIFDKDFISKTKIMYVNTFMLKILFFSAWIKNQNSTFEDYVLIAKNFSKEIEYCTENMNKLENEFNDSYFFSTDFLLGK